MTQSAFEEYLSGPNVPRYLQHPDCYPTFIQLDLENPKRQDDWTVPVSQSTTGNNTPIVSPSQAEDRKYSQYFNKLNTDGLLYEPHLNSATSNYYNSHRVMKPVTVECGDDHSSTVQRESRKRSLFNNFINYPTTFGGAEKPGVVYHSTTNFGDKALIFGGLGILPMDFYEPYLRDLTDDYTIPPENITVRFDRDYDLPAPLSKDKLLSLASIPNEGVFQYTAGSNSILHLQSLRAPQFDANSEESGSSTTGTKHARYGVPITTCCGQCCRVSSRHVILYGGFMLITRINKDSVLGKIDVVKSIVGSNSMWLYDVINTTFKEITISVHPTYTAMFAKALQRFAFSMPGITIEENNMSGGTGVGASFVFEQ
ncbi:unnamed protein product [Ambrosiozyma monospora]|uniref:Unnamed protein product n=1 Tax=Ambrosiozyma monospora TaxID=43982 RepID=A0ACB5TQW1_AMBMO|nr:unnamed protein product [Ambrosiozyma monospora]